MGCLRKSADWGPGEMAQWLRACCLPNRGPKLAPEPPSGAHRLPELLSRGCHAISWPSQARSQWSTTTTHYTYIIKSTKLAECPLSRICSYYSILFSELFTSLVSSVTLGEWSLKLRQTKVSCSSPLYSGQQTVCTPRFKSARVKRPVTGTGLVLWAS